MKVLKSVFYGAALLCVIALLFIGCAGGGTARAPAFSGPTFLDAELLVSMGQPDRSFFNFAPTSWDMELPSNDIDIYDNSRYLVIASLGGGNSAGFNPFRLAFQGDAPNNYRPVVIESGPIDFPHAADEYVYFAIDISKFDFEYTNATQFYLNSNIANFGEFYMYMTHVNLEANKPDDAVDLTVAAVENWDGPNHETVHPEDMTFGYITKNIPLMPER